MILHLIQPSGTQLVEIYGVGQREIPTWTPTEQGQRLRARRLGLRMGLWEAAARAELHLAQWSSIEIGHASVSDEDFERLMRTLED